MNLVETVSKFLEMGEGSCLLGGLEMLGSSCQREICARLWRTWSSRWVFWVLFVVDAQCELGLGRQLVVARGQPQLVVSWC